MTSNRELITRDRILVAARPIVERYTASKFSMEDVARAACVARQTIYKHFSGRGDLLVAMYIAHLEEMHKQLAPLLALKPSVDQLVLVFFEELQQAEQFPLFDAARDPAEAPKVAELIFGSEALLQQRNTVWFPIFRRHIDAGVVAADLDVAAAVRWITYQQFWLVTHPTVLAPDEKSRMQYIRDFLIGALLVK